MFTAFADPLAFAGTSAPIPPGPSRPAPRSDLAQRAVDLVFGVFLLILLAPLIGLALLAVKLTSRGPAIYTQTRLGRMGRPFVIYKIRSMTHECEKKSGIRWCQASDRRVTKVGWVLRWTHIDEMPQLWNIIRGDMSLVGPRPERPEIVVTLEKEIACYRDRLLVRPGLTGLAQLQLAPDTDLESVRRKLLYDLHYMEIGSAWLDARLVIATVFHVVRVPFAMIAVFLRLPTEAVVEPNRRVRPADESLVETASHTVCPPTNYREVAVDAARA